MLQPRCSNKQLLVAQILSVVAFLLSLAGWWLAWISGLIAMIALLVACCVAYPRCLWIVIALLALIAAVSELLVLIGVVSQDKAIYCGGGSCAMGKAGTVIISVVALISWLGVGYVSWYQSAGSGNNGRSLPR